MAISKPATSARIVPAQLSFLSIYNPAFGQTDEAAYDQIFYYFSQDDVDARKDSGTKPGKVEARQDGQSIENVHNDRLRQVGLARGMVEFANNFSNGIPVDTIETERSRIVLKELESGWWILASIDLTRLPAAMKEANRDTADPNPAGQTMEYSAREVTPPQLLLAQLQQAHSIFLLHHASCLTDLLQRLGRELFTNTLERYWSRFALDWDVLLHGNPAIDIYNSTKLAGGGEIGMGVGEEEWGSGEREVLEDFVHRTDGLLDVIVGRYGDPPRDAPSTSEQVKTASLKPWLGLEDSARATDGILFSGVGSLSRRSLATVSQWMDAIFKHGEHAYGVGENPSSRPRHRRKGRKLEATNGEEKPPRARPVKQGEPPHPRVKSPKAKLPDYRRKAMENAATPPGIPAPLVTSVERSIGSAPRKIEKREGSHSPTKEETRAEATNREEQDQAYFDPEKMMNYLKLGYGSSWTLSPKGFQKDAASRKDNESQLPFPLNQQEELRPELQQVDPTPEVSDDETETDKVFVQHLEQSIGRFLIGLTGDLENTEFDDETPESPESSVSAQLGPKRIYMRTIVVQMSESHTWDKRRARSSHGFQRSPSFKSSNSAEFGGPKTSAAASTDGSAPNGVYEKVRVVVYVHQPFIFTFLFSLQTPSLTIPAFYRRIHHQLGPLQKPLLRSTDPTRIPMRLLELIGEKVWSSEAQNSGLYDLVYDPFKLTVRTSIPNIPLPGTLAADGILASQNSTSTSRTVSGAWYTLGIPVGSTAGHSPKTSIDGGTLLQTEWTRLEALNVHTQVLNIWATMRKSGTEKLNTTGDLEQTIKTARGWWVVWMRLPSQLLSTPGTRPSSSATMRHWKESLGGSEAREAFLVRKSFDAGMRAKEANAKSASSGRWLLRDQTRDVSGSTAASQGAGATNTRGVIEGVGVDARRWVEGLSKLSQ